MSVFFDRVRDPSHFTYLESDLSFLEELGLEEERHIREIFDQIQQPNHAWTREVEDVRPWVQGIYEKLAEIFDLTANQESRHGRQKSENHADHYLTLAKWSLFCSAESSKIDFTKCWAFETSEGNWQPLALKKAIVQCHRYSGRFFDYNVNCASPYVSIITDARKFRLWYAYWGNGHMKGHETQDYEWNQDTLEVLGRVFKTFKMRVADPGNSDAGRDMIEEQQATNEAFYSVIIDSERLSESSGLPVVATTIGDIEARRFLGMGSNTVVFAGLMNGAEVAIKYFLDRGPLRREANALRKLSGVEDIPRLLHESTDGLNPYIVTSMVGREVTRVDAWVACNIVIDILEVLKNLHGHHFVHNDINPGNIVKVDYKFRLIDFGRAIHCCDERDTAPSDWPKGHIMFASHNYEKYPGAGDDLEALCYTVTYMHNRNREYWRAAVPQPLEALRKREKLRNIRYLFDDLPRVFQDFFNYVYCLDFAATPDYEHWRERFMSTARILP